jgi:hypothetical protein
VKSKFYTFKNAFVFILAFACLVLLIKLNFFIYLITGAQPLHDFDAYYKLSGDVLRQINPYSVPYMRTWGPPLVFIYYIPFQLLDLPTARGLTSVINIISGIAICIILAKNLYKSNLLSAFLVLFLILFSSFPARFSLEMGQPNLIQALIITSILFVKKVNLKSFLLGLLISIKTYFILTIFTFVKKEKQVYYKSILIAAFIAFLVSLIIKPEYYYHYYKNTLPELLRTGTYIAKTDYYNQTYFSTLSRLGVNFPHKEFFAIITLIGTFLLYLAANFEIAIILSLILSIVSWQHYYVVLFPIYIKALRDSPKNFYGNLFVMLLIIFWWIEFPWLHESHLTLLNGLLASHYFLSALLLAIYIAAMHWLTSNKLKSYNTSSEN